MKRGEIVKVHSYGGAVIRAVFMQWEKGNSRGKVKLPDGSELIVDAIQVEKAPPLK